ncbi:MAG: flagellar basal body L-ring protein FlgH [Myxococcota bacterium]
MRTRYATRYAWLVALCAVASNGCATGPRHIAPYAPKSRTFDAGEYELPSEPAAGSIYADQRGWLEDDRAGRIGDVLVVQIDERETAVRQNTTKLKRKGNNEYGVPNAFGLMAKLQRKYPNIDPTKLFATNSLNTFDGSGSSQKSGRLTATLPVRVKEIMPNGDLFVEGTNVVMVSNEEHHLYVSGIVRKIDIKADNTVLSSRIANAEIEYIGRGDLSDQQRPGWGSRAAVRGAPF